MGAYRKAVITDRGQALMGRVLAGEATMRFTRAVTSDYVYADGTDFTKMEELQGIKQSVVPSNAQIRDETLVCVRVLFGNEKIMEEYLIQNVGLYASDGGSEILFSVSQASGPDKVPVYNGVAPSSYIYNVQLAVSRATSLTLQVNPAGTATAEDIAELAARIGHVIIGAEDMALGAYDTLFVVDAPDETRFGGASYSNMEFSNAPPATGENWAQLPGADALAVRAAGDIGIIDGRLAVSEEPSSDAAFFAEVN